MEEAVLIVGAGPTGLVLALWLTEFGVPVRIIDKNSEPGQTSRAMVVHARTLEFYQQLGCASDLVNSGIILNLLNLRKKNKKVASIDIGGVGENISPFPFILSLPQDKHEQILIELLAKKGVQVERHVELISFTQDDNQVTATLKINNQLSTISTSYLLGCDGAKSTVRTQLGVKFSGGTYSQIFYVADVMTTGDIKTNAIQICLRDDGFALLFPIRNSGSIRLIGIVPKDKAQKVNIEFADVESVALQGLHVAVTKVNWFSIYHSHHRVAEKFRENRVFLLGDAGHIHSPVGGQGMNTGIGDAVNLAWKIAAVLQARADDSILETYAIERIPFALRLVNTTDKLFQIITNQGLVGKFFRSIFFPYMFALLTKWQFIRNFQFKTVSQILINYRNSPLSIGGGKNLSAGDRLPWISAVGFDNYQSLSVLDWQVHVYGELSGEVKATLQGFNLRYREFPWRESYKKYFFIENAIYLIRPDGYIAFIGKVQDICRLRTYLARYKIRGREH